MKDSKFIKVHEAAEMLGVSSQTIRNWGKMGILNINKAGKYGYIDKQTIECLLDTAHKTEMAKQKLEKLHDDIQNEYNEIRNNIHDERITRRYLFICLKGSIESSFYESIVNLLVYCGTLDKREGMILVDKLNGLTLAQIGSKFNVSEERVRQIANKAIRRSKQLTRFKEMFEQMESLRKDNETLKIALANSYRKSDPMHIEDMAKERVYTLLCKPISDCQLSVRAKNVLSYMQHGTIKTIGDLVKLNKNAILSSRNAGKKTFNEIDSFLEKHGLTWEMDVDVYYDAHANFILSAVKPTCL